MSTLLTPVLTQIEIDRDRFKALVNGGELDTVQLEDRVEYSISGQVRRAIDQYAAELDLAQEASTAAEQAAQNAKGSEDNAQLYAQDTLGLRDETSSIRDETQVIKNDTADIKTETENLVSLIGDGEIRKTPFSSIVLYPINPPSSDPVDSYPKENLHLMGGVFDSNSDRIKWGDRHFQIVKPTDPDFNREEDQLTEDENGVPENYTVEFETTSKNDSVYVGDIGLIDDDLYAWKFTDSYTDPDVEYIGDFEQEEKYNGSEFVFFSVSSGLEYIEKPTLTASPNSNGSVEIGFSSPSLINSTKTVNNTLIRIVDSDDNVVFDETLNGYQSTYTIQESILEGGTYSVKSSYVSNRDLTVISSIAPIYSPWSDYVDFKLPDTIDSYTTKSQVTTGIIDVNDATVFRVDGTTNTTLTLSEPTLPSDRAKRISVFVEEGTGTITWPTEISWDGGDEPVLGNTWTNVLLFWTGTMWIGHTESSQQ